MELTHYSLVVTELKGCRLCIKPIFTSILNVYLSSVTATASSHHVIILFQHHILSIIEVEQVDGEELVRDAARCRNTFNQLQGINDGLDSGVVGRPHVLTQREGTGAFAVVSVVTPGRHNPAWPANLLKVHVEWQALAGKGHTLFLAVVHRAGTAGRWTWQGGLRQAGGGCCVVWIWRRKEGLWANAVFNITC